MCVRFRHGLCVFPAPFPLLGAEVTKHKDQWRQSPGRQCGASICACEDRCSLAPLARAHSLPLPSVPLPCFHLPPKRLTQHVHLFVFALLLLVFVFVSALCQEQTALSSWQLGERGQYNSPSPPCLASPPPPSLLSWGPRALPGPSARLLAAWRCVTNLPTPAASPFLFSLSLFWSRPLRGLCV